MSLTNWVSVAIVGGSIVALVRFCCFGVWRRWIATSRASRIYGSIPFLVAALGLGMAYDLRDDGPTAQLMRVSTAAVWVVMGLYGPVAKSSSWRDSATSRLASQIYAALSSRWTDSWLHRRLTALASAAFRVLSRRYETLSTRWIARQQRRRARHASRGGTHTGNGW